MMKPGQGAITTLAAMWLAAWSQPQGGLSAQQRAPEAGSTATRPAATLDVNKLPLDLQRIERQLRQTSEREEREGLRLRYFVDVYGKAPQIELFLPGENLRTGPVPWGAPTHQEMIQLNTPQEFRSPPMDLNNAVRWLTDKLNKK